MENTSTGTMILTIKNASCLTWIGLISTWIGKKTTIKLQRFSFCNPPLSFTTCMWKKFGHLIVDAVSELPPPSHMCAIRSVSLVNHTLWLKYTFIKYLEGLKPLKITAKLKELRGWYTKQPDTKVKSEIVFRNLQIGDRTMTTPIG